MKAQAAFEYMLVVLIALGFLIPVWTYMLSVNNQASDELSLSYARDAVEELASSADLVYSQGPPARVRVSVYIPGGVEGFNITNRTILLTVRHGGDVTGIFATSKARLNGTVPTAKGMYWMDIRAVDNANYDIDIRKA